jgi:hypothetical protein
MQNEPGKAVCYWQNFKIQIVCGNDIRKRQSLIIERTILIVGSG